MRVWLGNKQEIYSKDFYNNVCAQHWDIVDLLGRIRNVLVGTEAVAVSKEKRASGEELDIVCKGSCVCKGRDTRRWQMQKLWVQQLAKGGGANGEEVAIDTSGGFSWEGWHWEEDQGWFPDSWCIEWLGMPFTTTAGKRRGINSEKEDCVELWRVWMPVMQCVLDWEPQLSNCLQQIGLWESL